VVNRRSQPRLTGFATRTRQHVGGMILLASCQDRSEAMMSPTLRLRELFRYRELVRNLTMRDLRVRYRRSGLGTAWSLLNPLVMMLIYVSVFSLLLRIVVLQDYWAFVLAGLLPWIFMSTAIVGAATSFISNGHLIMKVYFPIESLTISVVLANVVNFLISLVVFVVIELIFHRALGPSVVLIPIVVLATLAMTTGIGLIVASLTVYFRDLEHLLQLALSAIFYLSPIIYPLDVRVLPPESSQYLPYLRLNPFSWYLETYHSILYWGTWPDAGEFTLVMVSAAFILVAGYAWFSAMRARLPEEL
jgi:lipopolysaccharide transport system permease protein